MTHAITNLDLPQRLFSSDAESLIIRFHFSLPRHAFAYTVHRNLGIEQVTGNLHVATSTDQSSNLLYRSVPFEFLNFFYFTFLSKSEFLFILSLLEKRWIENRWMDVWKKTCLLSSIPWNWNFILFSFTWNFYPLLFSSLFIWKQK